MKKFLSVLLIAAIMLTVALPAFAAGTSAKKEEVVYGVLRSDGSVQSIYVVNKFKGGMITDYGDYSAVNNMTSPEKLTQSGDKITINTSSDQFYYQGTLETKALPWNIAVKYKLDGKERTASKLAGKSGALAINISIKQNKAVNPAFNENYMLQVSLTLDTDKCTDIASPNAAFANAGKNKVITHTVLPGKDANIMVSANVRDLAMKGIEITAIPLSMFIEKPDTRRLTEDMTSLVDAVSALNDGAGELSEGTQKTHSGANELTDASSEIADGLSELGGNTDEILSGSSQIKGGLNDVVRELAEKSDNFDLDGLDKLPKGLTQLAGGLNEITSGMQNLKKGYAPAYSALDSAIAKIPDTDIDSSGLYTAVNGNQELTAELDQLMRYYAAARAVKGTYAAVQQAFASVAGSLDTMSGSIGKIAGTLSEMAREITVSLRQMDLADQMQQLQDGLTELRDNYKQFHASLKDYMSGVESLADGYGKVQDGMKSLTDGIGALNAGAEDLSGGTGQLNDATAELPDTIQVEIDQLLKQYDKSGFVPVSFVSDKNTNVAAVQFVLETAPIELPQEPEPADTTHVKLTFWQKLLKLFGL